MDEKEKIFEWVKTGNDAVDAKADSLLDKVKASAWTPAILGVGIASVFVLCLLAWLVG